jgi:hypothetical protein
MGTRDSMNKYGLMEYSFEIGPIDDSGETVAIVGLEYSSVSDDEKFYRKEDVDALIAEKDKEIARLNDLAHAHNIELRRKENLIAELREQVRRKFRGNKNVC